VEVRLRSYGRKLGEVGCTVTDVSVKYADSRHVFFILLTPLLKTVAAEASETRLHGITYPEGRNVIYIALKMSHFIKRVKANPRC
jgi:hypothetical protein